MRRKKKREIRNEDTNETTGISITRDASEEKGSYEIVKGTAVERGEKHFRSQRNRRLPAVECSQGGHRLQRRQMK